MIAALPGQTSPVTSLDFSMEGYYLASVSEETLMVWSVVDIEVRNTQLNFLFKGLEKL